jgi:hypothetical protein
VKERKAKKIRKSTNRDLVLRDEEERFLAHRINRKERGFVYKVPM